MRALALALVHNLSPAKDLNAYVKFANSVPLLSQEEESKLIASFREHKDLSAARQLILSHLRLVIKIARDFSGYGLPQADLVQEGNIGLMKAVNKFDPKFKVRLVSFAIHWIKAEIHEFVIKNWRIVKIATTKAQRKLFFNLRKKKKKLTWFTEEETNQLASDLNVKTTEVTEMEKRLYSSDASFNASNDEDDFAPENYLDSDVNPETAVVEYNWKENVKTQLAAAWTHLDERSRDIIQSRWIQEDNKPTLHDLAAKYKISAERVRQLESRALKTLRSMINV